MYATIYEIFGQEQKSAHSIEITPDQCPITFGRDRHSTYQIGLGLGAWAQGISNTHATILDKEGKLYLIDGRGKEPSTNGVFMHGKRINGEIELTPGTLLTLYKHGGAKIDFALAERTEPGVSLHSRETYGEDDLTALMQQQTQALQDQVALLGKQLKDRLTVDEHQQQRLDKLEMQIRKAVSFALITAATVVVLSGLFGDLSVDQKRKWNDLVYDLVSRGLVAVVLGGSALYVSKEKRAES